MLYFFVQICLIFSGMLFAQEAVDLLPANTTKGEEAEETRGEGKSGL